MNDKENNQKDIPSKFSDNLSIPNDIDFSDMDKNYDMCYLNTQNIMMPHNLK